MRRHATAALVVSLLPWAATTPAAPADELTVLTTSEGELPPGKRLYAYLEGQAKAEFDARRKAVAALKTPADVARRQSELRAKFRRTLGDLPAQRTPLNGKTFGAGRREGCRVERVIYESRPGHHVTALLYLPDGPPPYPGVLVPCGHSANGKAAEPYQRACLLLARNGMAALCYDPVGQGERAQLLDEAGKPAVNDSTTEHTLLGVGALLVGRSAAGYRVWDGIRSLDYLASRPEIDPSRLGCTGNSGGGTLTCYLMALDDRIAAAAPSCYVTSLERLFATIGPQDAEQNLTGQVALGIEHADFVTMRAPKPTLLSVGTRDYFDIDGAWTSFREAKKIYGTLGYGERVDLFESDETHGFTKPRREACVRWLRRWLLGKDDAVTEPDFPVATDAECRVTGLGQVLAEYTSTSAFDLNAGRAEELDKARVVRGVAALREEVRKRLALRDATGSLVVYHPGRLDREGYTVDKWAVESEPGVKVPVLLYRTNAGAGDKPLIVYVGADRSFTAPGGPVETLVKAGQWVALVDPRGMGETTPDGRRAGLIGADEREAFLALLLDRPLLGQRVFDVLRALRALIPSKAPGSFHLIGVGDGGPVALHAAALDDRVSEVTLQRSIVSWSSVVRTPLSRNQLAQVVPGVLASYDLPDLAASLAPRPLTVAEAVDPAGKPLDPGVLESAYAACRKAYREKGGEARLTLK